MSVKLNAKDLPQHGLKIITPSDPSFDGRLNASLKDQPNDVIDNLKPLSFFIENKSNQVLVAYAIRWCFTKADGTNSYQLEFFSDHQALMEGQDFPDKYESQSSWIKPHSTRFFSIVALNGSSGMRFEISREELEQIKQGMRFDQKTMLQRYAAELAKYTDITVSIDGAFFDDGTFVGLDSTGFFENTKAEIAARHDLLHEIALGLSQKSTDEVFQQVEILANQPDKVLDAEATPTDHYNQYKRFYARHALRIRKAYGDEKGIAAVLHPMQKPWHKLQKKQD